MDVVGNGDSVDVFAGGLGKSGDNAGNFRFVEDIGEPEAGFGLLSEGAAFEAVPGVGFAALDGDVVEASLGVGTVDAAEGFLGVCPREPHLAVGCNAIIGIEMVGVGSLKGRPAKHQAGGG